MPIAYNRYATKTFFYIKKGLADSLLTSGWDATIHSLKGNSTDRDPLVMIKCTISHGVTGIYACTIKELRLYDVQRVVMNKQNSNQLFLKRECNDYAMSHDCEPLYGGDISVYRTPNLQDSTNKGVSTRNNTLSLIGVNTYKSDLVDKLSKCVIPVYTGRHSVGLMPISAFIACNKPMMGGNFAFTSHSGFTAFSELPLPIYDRLERVY